MNEARAPAFAALLLLPAVLGAEPSSMGVWTEVRADFNSAAGSSANYCTASVKGVEGEPASFHFHLGTVDPESGPEERMGRGVGCSSSYPAGSDRRQPPHEEGEPYLRLDVTVVPYIEQGADFRLEVSVAGTRFQRFNEAGDPVYEQTVRTRTLRIPLRAMEREALMPAYIATEEEGEALDLAEVTLRFRARVASDPQRDPRFHLRYERVDPATGEEVARAQTTVEDQDEFVLSPPPAPLPFREEEASYALEGSIVPVDREGEVWDVALQIHQWVRTPWYGTASRIEKSFTLHEGETVRLDLQPVRGNLTERLASGEEHTIQLEPHFARYRERLYVTLLVDD